MISIVGQLHANLIFDRRVRVLSDILCGLMPTGASVLDVGCGDGTIAARIQAKRPDLRIEGIDVMVRPVTKIPVTQFDGTRLPFADQSWDVGSFADVLHHTNDPRVLVSEAVRVARSCVIIKDHFADSSFDRSVLSLMDWVGNAPHGVVLPYNYLSRSQWRVLFDSVRLRERSSTDDVALYPWPLSAVFGRNLHFVTALSAVR